MHVVSVNRRQHLTPDRRANLTPCEDRMIVQRTKIPAELASMLKSLGISAPKQILAVEEPSQGAAAA